VAPELTWKSTFEPDAVEVTAPPPVPKLGEATFAEVVLTVVPLLHEKSLCKKPVAFVLLILPTA
jgi:hypothetical protein